MLLVLFLLLFVLVVVLAYLGFLIDLILGKEDFASNRLAIEKFIGIVKQRGLENGRIYDLGCARGNFAVKIARGLPKAKIIGVDDSRFRIFLAKARSIFLANVRFYKGNIFNIDLSAADLVYIYLPQPMLPDLQVKLQKQMKKGSLIISNSVSFADWQPIEVVQKLFIYQIL